MTEQTPATEAGRLTPEEAVEAALLYVFQLSDKDYRKMQTAMSEIAFMRALAQDGYAVLPVAIEAEARADAPMLTCKGCGDYIAGEYWHEGCGSDEYKEATDAAMNYGQGRADAGFDWDKKVVSERGKAYKRGRADALREAADAVRALAQWFDFDGSSIIAYRAAVLAILDPEAT